MMRALITGVTGFVGSHMAEFLLKKGVEVYGAKRWRSPMDNIMHIKNDIHLEEFELRDFSSVNRVITKVRPDVIYHLAAQSYVPASFLIPADTLAANVIGTANLLEAIRLNKLDPVVHICSSSEVYGQVRPEEVPIKETNPLRPVSPYAVSKVGEDMLGYQYYVSYGIRTIRTRMFTHSVSKWTPIIMRDTKSGMIDIVYISEIRKAGKLGGYFSGEMLEDGTQIWDMSRSDMEVWNDNSWAKIKHLSCHPLKGHKLLEISCRSGVVDVTDNHSIIDERGNEVKAGELKTGDKVKITALPCIELTEMAEEPAWLYGFFVAEGCVTAGRMRLDNKNRSKLEKSKVILLKYFGADSQISSEKNGMYRLSVRKPFHISKRFYEDCYASDKNKRVPRFILNASSAVKRAFLLGYNAGDGDENNKVKSEIYRFKTKSPILAAGVCYLVESVLKIKYRIHVEHRDDARYFEIRCLTQTGTDNGKWLLKGDNDITKITELNYSDEVWDFETENHWFHAGIGGNIVHNTGPRRGEFFVESSFAKQIAEIEKGVKKEPFINVGNLESIRTFADVRDAVRAYWLLTEKCRPGEVYNIGGDATMKVGEMMQKLIGMSQMKGVIKPRMDPSLIRPSDVTLQIPDTTKFRSETGWKPEVPFEKTLKDLLDYWRARV